MTADAAEETADKPLEREFIEAAARSLAIQFALGTSSNIVSRCAALCESPLELAMVFALGVIGLEMFGSILFDLPTGCCGNADGDTVLQIKPQAKIGRYRVDFLLTLVTYQKGESGVSLEIATCFPARQCSPRGSYSVCSEHVVGSLPTQVPPKENKLPISHHGRRDLQRTSLRKGNKLRRAGYRAGLERPLVLIVGPN